MEDYNRSEANKKEYFKQQQALDRRAPRGFARQRGGASMLASEAARARPRGTRPALTVVLKISSEPPLAPSAPVLRYHLAARPRNCSSGAHSRRNTRSSRTRRQPSCRGTPIGGHGYGPSP